MLIAILLQSSAVSQRPLESSVGWFEPKMANRQQTAVARVRVASEYRTRDRAKTEMLSAPELKELDMGKMKTYASFDEYWKDQNSRNREIISALRSFVKHVEPKLTESVKWGNGCWIGSKGPVAYVYSATGYVQFGFFYGSSLKDPKGLLEGAGKFVRHTKVHDVSEIDKRAFTALLKQASALR